MCQTRLTTIDLCSAKCVHGADTTDNLAISVADWNADALQLVASVIRRSDLLLGCMLKHVLLSGIRCV